MIPLSISHLIRHNYPQLMASQTPGRQDTRDAISAESSHRTHRATDIHAILNPQPAPGSPKNVEEPQGPHFPADNSRPSPSSWGFPVSQTPLNSWYLQSAIPVDCVSASKRANKQRSANRGASKRHHDRNKALIAHMETKIKALTEKRDRYLVELKRCQVVDRTKRLEQILANRRPDITSPPPPVSQRSVVTSMEGIEAES